MEHLLALIDGDGFMPHGHCYLWTPALLWGQALSNLAIAGAYFSIPFALTYFVRKREDIVFRPMFLMFGLFIMSCGFTHLMDLWTIWRPAYWLDVAVRMFTAGASVSTAWMLWVAMPKALALPSPVALEQANRSLREEISARKLSEERLRASEERFRLLVEGLQDHAMWMMAPDGTVESWNPGAARIYGYSEEEVIGQPAARLYRPEDVAAGEFDALLARARRDGSCEEEGWRVRRDGSRFYANVVTTALHGPDGALRGFARITRDITQRREAEAALRAAEAARESQARLQEMADAMPQIVWTSNAEGLAEYFNRRWYEVTGANHEVSLGQGWSKWVHPDDREAVFESWRAALAAGEVLQIEERIYDRRSGSFRWHLARAVPVRAPGGNVVRWFGTATDVHELREAQRELQEQAQDLARSNEELEQFAYVASHDLQEPLRMVSAFTQLLERRYAERFDGEGREFMHYVIDGARGMQRLIDDLLAYSRIGRRGQPPRPVAADEALGQARANLKLAIDETAARIDCDPLPCVSGDEPQLVQLFQNLIANAIKFRGSNRPHIRIAAVRHGVHWRFSVADNGIGIAPAHFERIFVIFQRLHSKSEYPGTGIGLAACKKIVERHGGRIWVESQPGGGATFFFTLPAVDDPREQG
jgi:PAS domain S-box-containing protein